MLVGAMGCSGGVVAVGPVIATGPGVEVRLGFAVASGRVWKVSSAASFGLYRGSHQLPRNTIMTGIIIASSTSTSGRATLRLCLGAGFFGGAGLSVGGALTASLPGRNSPS